MKNKLIVPSFIEEYAIEDGMFNYENITSLHFPFLLAELKHIAIGENCCKNIHRLVVDGLPNLESVEIGENSFRINWENRTDGICRFANCPALRELIIDRNSFYYHQSLELVNLNSLQRIKFGDSCFCSDCILKGVRVNASL